MVDDPPEKPVRRHLNASQKRALKAAEIELFAQRYGRKAQRGTEPNDRRYSHKTEKAAKSMRPEQLDRRLRDDED